MRAYRAKCKRLLSLILAACLVLTMAPAAPSAAFADDVDPSVGQTAADAESGAGSESDGGSASQGATGGGDASPGSDLPIPPDDPAPQDGDAPAGAPEDEGGDDEEGSDEPEAQAVEPQAIAQTTYYDYDPATGAHKLEGPIEATVLDSSLVNNGTVPTVGVANQTTWYLVNQGTTLSGGNRLLVEGDVGLILGSGSTYLLREGIELAPGATLTIYSQTEGGQGKIAIEDGASIRNVAQYGWAYIGSGGRGYPDNLSAKRKVVLDSGVITSNKYSGMVGSGTIGHAALTGMTGALIGNAAESAAVDVAINGGAVELVINQQTYGAIIGGGKGSVGEFDVAINGGTVTALRYNMPTADIEEGAAIGDGVQGSGAQIVVAQGKSESGGNALSCSANAGAGIGGSSDRPLNGGPQTSIKIVSGKISSSSLLGAGIGTGARGARVSVLIEGGEVRSSVSGSGVTPTGSPIGGGKDSDGAVMAINGGYIVINTKSGCPEIGGGSGSVLTIGEGGGGAYIFSRNNTLKDVDAETDRDAWNCVIEDQTLSTIKSRVHGTVTLTTDVDLSAGSVQIVEVGYGSKLVIPDDVTFKIRNTCGVNVAGELVGEVIASMNMDPHISYGDNLDLSAFGSGVKTLNYRYPTESSFSAPTASEAGVSVPAGMALVWHNQENGATYKPGEEMTGFAMPERAIMLKAELVEAGEEVTFRDYVESEGGYVDRTEEATPLTLEKLQASNYAIGEDGEDTWYVVNESLDLSEQGIRIKAYGNVGLILPNERTLTTDLGIAVMPNANLTFYGQEGDTGKVHLVGKGLADVPGGDSEWAFIGPGADGESDWTTERSVTVDGGTIAFATEDSISSGFGAAIGGASGMQTTASNCTDVTINGGVVDFAISTHGAGIGGGNNITDGSKSEVVINGGEVRAASIYGAAIGGGNHSPNSGVDVVVNGGYVYAETLSRFSSAIGNSYQGDTGKFSIGPEGAFIVAEKNGEFDLAIYDQSGKTYDSWRGVVVEGEQGYVYGDSFILRSDAELPGASQFQPDPLMRTLTVESGKKLTVSDGVELRNYGVIQVAGELEVVGEGKVENLLNEGVGEYGRIEYGLNLDLSGAGGGGIVTHAYYEAGDASGAKAPTAEEAEITVPAGKKLVWQGDDGATYEPGAAFSMPSRVVTLTAVLEDDFVSADYVEWDADALEWQTRTCTEAIPVVYDGSGTIVLGEDGVETWHYVSSNISATGATVVTRGNVNLILDVYATLSAESLRIEGDGLTVWGTRPDGGQLNVNSSVSTAGASSTGYLVLNSGYINVGKGVSTAAGGALNVTVNGGRLWVIDGDLNVGAGATTVNGGHLDSSAGGIKGSFSTGAKGQGYVSSSEKIEDRSREGSWRGVIAEEGEGRVRCEHRGEVLLNTPYQLAGTLTVPYGTGLAVVSGYGGATNYGTIQVAGTLDVTSISNYPGAKILYGVNLDPDGSGDPSRVVTLPDYHGAGGTVAAPTQAEAENAGIAVSPNMKLSAWKTGAGTMKPGDTFTMPASSVKLEPAWELAAVQVKYMDFVKQGEFEERDATALPITEDMRVLGEDEKTTWYVVNSDVTFSDTGMAGGAGERLNRLHVKGDVRLILADGCTMTAGEGIDVSDDDMNSSNGSPNKFTVYGQRGGTGKLEATSTYGYNAAIGSSCLSTYAYSGGALTFNGGIVETSGTIGGGSGTSNYKPDGGTIVVNGGTVNATGASNSAAIGGGYYGNCGTISITGGTVNATAIMTGTGIGSGRTGRYGNGSVTISGGVVNVAGPTGSIGIGSGYGADPIDVSITGGTVRSALTGTENPARPFVGIGAYNDGTTLSSAPSVTISGGTVTAHSIANCNDEGSSFRFSTGQDGNAFIVAGMIADQPGKQNGTWRGAIVEGATVNADGTASGGVGRVFGDVTLGTAAVLPQGADLVLPNDSSLNANNLLTNQGRILVDNHTEGKLTGMGTAPGTVLYRLKVDGGTADAGAIVAGPENGTYFPANAQATPSLTGSAPVGQALAGWTATNPSGQSYGTSFAMPAYALDVAPRYLSAPEYYVTIPESVMLTDEAGGTQADVTASGVSVAAGESLRVTVAGKGLGGAFTMQNGSDGDVGYSIFRQSSSVSPGGTVLEVGGGTAGAAGSAQLVFKPVGTPRFAGTYEGTATFTVSVGPTV